MLLAGMLHAQSPTSSSSSKTRSEQSQISAPDPGSIANGIYHNSFFGFGYKLYFGWVDRTTGMREDSSEDSNDPKKSMLLLAAFEHPPEVAGDSVNSAVVVAAEAVSSYAGLQNAEQYFGPVTELTKSKGFTVVQICAGLIPSNEELAPSDPGFCNEGGCGGTMRLVCCVSVKEDGEINSELPM